MHIAELVHSCRPARQQSIFTSSYERLEVYNIYVAREQTLCPVHTDLAFFMELFPLGLWPSECQSAVRHRDAAIKRLPEQDCRIIL